jgi:hypothetical protein
MSETRDPAPDPDDDGPEDPASHDEVSLLRTENERLRRELKRRTRTTYRRTALALLVVGAVSALAGLVVPPAREVLVVVGAIGVFGGILTWYLTPETVLSASVAESLFDANASTRTALVAELGLLDDAVYVPSSEHVGGAYLFLPLHATYELPESVESTFLTAGTDRERGIALQPTGARLCRELDHSIRGDIDESDLPAVVTEALVEQFELAANANGELVDDTLSLHVDRPAIAGLDRPDHPVVSLAGVTTARSLDQPVRVDAVDPDEGRIVLSW